MTQNATEELIRTAAKLLNTPETWCQKRSWLAEDTQGNQVDPLSDLAVKFSPAGALLRAVADLKLSEEDFFSASLVLNRIITKRIGDQGLGSYNSQVNHAMVVSLFEEAAI